MHKLRETTGCFEVKTLKGYSIYFFSAYFALSLLMASGHVSIISWIEAETKWKMHHMVLLMLEQYVVYFKA